jgi:hypothetical protein
LPPSISSSANDLPSRLAASALSDTPFRFASLFNLSRSSLATRTLSWTVFRFFEDTANILTAPV